MSGHTEGPWSVRTDTDLRGHGYMVRSDSGKDIARVMYKVGEERLSNAHLIAAAPELLEVVQEYLQNRELMIAAGGTEGPLSQDVITQFANLQDRLTQKAKAAIAKAEKP